MMQWVQADAADFSGTTPQPRSGHSAVRVGKSMVVVFGGLVDKKFLNDVVVFDTENKLWFEPDCTGNGIDGQIGPCPRAFHVAVAIDCHMFIFGGRSGRKRLGDFWMLDTAKNNVQTKNNEAPNGKGKSSPVTNSSLQEGQDRPTQKQPHT